MDFKDFCLIKLGVSPSQVRNTLQLFLEEDVGLGDTTVLTLPFLKKASFSLIAKKPFRVCGLPLTAEVFSLACDKDLSLKTIVEEGSDVKAGDIILSGEGSYAGLLLGERTGLNLASHLSGIATHTHNFATLKERILGTSPRLLDTRKTTPGLKLYEKYAVRTGGAYNHRYSLSSGAMLKENHLRSTSQLKTCLENTLVRVPLLTKVEVEVSNITEFKQALETTVDVIMLDNFSLDMIKEALALKEKSSHPAKIEVSGNITEESLSTLVGLDIDFISSGALIHQSRWVDMSLQIFPI